jgi:hypothetical protein
MSIVLAGIKRSSFLLLGVLLSAPSVWANSAEADALEALQIAFDAAGNGFEVSAGEDGMFRIRSPSCTYDVPGWGGSRSTAKYAEKKLGFKHYVRIYRPIGSISRDCAESSENDGVALSYPFDRKQMGVHARSSKSAEMVSNALGGLSEVLRSEYGPDQRQMDTAVARFLEEFQTSFSANGLTKTPMGAKEGYNPWGIPGLVETSFSTAGKTLELRFDAANPLFANELADQFAVALTNAGATLENYLDFLTITGSNGRGLGSLKRSSSTLIFDAYSHYQGVRTSADERLDAELDKVAASMCGRAFTYQETNESLDYSESAGMLIVEIFALRHEHPELYQKVADRYSHLEGLLVAQRYTAFLAAAVVEQCPAVRQGIALGIGGTDPEVERLAPIREAIERELLKAYAPRRMDPGTMRATAKGLHRHVASYTNRDVDRFLGFNRFMLSTSAPYRALLIHMAAHDVLLWEQSRGTSKQNRDYNARLERVPALERLVTQSGKPHSHEAEERRREAARRALMSGLGLGASATSTTEAPVALSASPADYSGSCEQRTVDFWHDRGWSTFGGPYSKTLDPDGRGNGSVDRIYTDDFVFVVVAEAGSPLSLTLRSGERLVTTTSTSVSSSEVKGDASAVECDGCQMVVLRDDARPEFDTQTGYEQMKYGIRRSGDGAPTRVSVLPMRPNRVDPD